MEQPREMNLFDLFAAMGRGIGRGVQNLLQGFGRLIRLSFRQWWIVLLVVLIAIADALYISREDNRIYKVDAVAMLNGVSKDVVSREFMALGKSSYNFVHQNMTTMLNVAPEVAVGNFRFVTYDVIDFMADHTIDGIDFNYDVPFTDSASLHVPHMLALQFRTKKPNNVPIIQEAILQYLNTRPGIVAPYAQFFANLERESKFHHDQLEKLDSLTSVFYFSHNQEAQIGLKETKHGVVLGGREITLFLDDVLSEMEVLNRTDNRLAYATAPVVLQTPFVIDPQAINGRFKCIGIAIVLGWFLGLIIAALVENRTEICHWLRQK
jgi:hypothetical protein